MNSLVTTVYSQEDELPLLSNKVFFHSKALFQIYAETPRIKPYMVVISTSEGKELCHLLASRRYHTSLFPPYLYTHCHILGEGEYQSEENREKLFRLMLQTITKKMSGKAFYIELSHLSTKMFAYKHLRATGFSPIKWMSIHNSLHSKMPIERLSQKQIDKIKQAKSHGVITKEVENTEELRQLVKLLQKHNLLKIKRYIPDKRFFELLFHSNQAKLYITQYKQKYIGCCVCVASRNNMYLWYMASLRKTYRHLHPDTLTVWYAIKQAHAEKYDHIYFMDVGLPYTRNPYREFILRFGGKPVSTLRWFRISISWLNKLLRFFSY